MQAPHHLSHEKPQQLLLAGPEAASFVRMGVPQLPNDGIQHRRIGDHGQPFPFNDGGGGLTGGKHGGQDLFRRVVVHLLLHQRGQQFRQLRGRYLDPGNAAQILPCAFLVQESQQLRGDPLGQQLRPAVGLAQDRHRSLEILGQRAFAGQQFRFLRAHLPLRLVPALFVPGHLGQGCADLPNPCAGYLQGWQIRFREVAVIVRTLFGALLDRAFPGLVPAHVDLLHDLAPGQQTGLSLMFVGNGGAHGAQTVEILDLDLHPQFAAGGLLRGPHGNIGFAPQRALLHVTVVHAQVPQKSAEPQQEAIGFVSAGHIRFGHNFHQGDTGPVQIHQRVRSGMGGFARILFQMHPPNANPFGFGPRPLKVHAAGKAERVFELGNLIALGQIRIGVILAGKDRRLRYLALQGQTGRYGRGHGALIDDGHGPRQTQTDGAHQGIGRSALVDGRAAAEHFAAGQQLGMHFHAHYHLIGVFRGRGDGGRAGCGHETRFRFRIITKAGIPYQEPVTANPPGQDPHCYTGTACGLCTAMISLGPLHVRRAGGLLLLACCLLLAGCNRRPPPLGDPTATPPPPTLPAPVSTPVPTSPAPTPTSTPRPPTPAERLAQARRQEIQGYVEEAAVLYAALSRQPDPAIASPAAYFLGRLQVAQEEWALADDSLALHFRLQGDTELPAAADYTGEAYLLWARVQRQLGAYAAASNYYGAALNGLPVLASDIHREWGQMQLALAQDDAGLAHLAQAAELAYAPSIQVSILDEMATALEARHRYAEAVAVYDEILAVAAQPAYRAQLEYRAGQALVQIQREAEAIARFRRATEARRDTVHAYLALVELVERDVEFDPYTRGFIDYYAGAYGVAAEAFGHYRALGQTEEFRAPYGEIYEGLSYAQLGDYRLAEARLQAALAQYPDCPCRGWAYLELLDLYLRLGNVPAYQATWEAYIQELPTDPGRARILAEQVSDLLQQGERGAAYTPLHDLLGFFPGSDVTAQALYAVVMDALAEQQYSEANSGLQQLREQFPDFKTAEVGYWIGYTLWQDGHTDAALFGWQRAARIRPVGFFGIMAAQALRRADGTSQAVIADMEVLSQTPAAGLQPDDGNPTRALDWLRSWADPAQGADLPAPAADINLQRGLVFHRLGNRERARQNWAAAVETYRSYPYHLWDLALLLAEQEAYQLSIRAAYYLYTLSPAEEVAELPVFVQTLLYPRPYRALLRAAAAAHQVPELYFYAVLRQESLFEPASVSVASAQGLGQVMPATGEWIALQLGQRDYQADWLQRPWLNLEFSAFYLRFVHDELDQNWLTALVGYNAGLGNGRAFREASGPDDMDFYRAISLAETSDYVEKIIANLWHYTRLYG